MVKSRSLHLNRYRPMRFLEFWAGTDPLDNASVFRAASSLLNGHLQVSWHSAPSKTYSVQYSTNLVSWTALAPPVYGNGSQLVVQDPSTFQQSGLRFYRVVLVDF